MRVKSRNACIFRLNGTVIGYYIAKYLTEKFTKYIVSDSKDRDFYIVCISVVVVMFMLQPFMSALLWEMVLR